MNTALLALGLEEKVGEQDNILNTLVCYFVKLRWCICHGLKSKCCDKAWVGRGKMRRKQGWWRGGCCRGWSWNELNHEYCLTHNTKETKNKVTTPASGAAPNPGKAHDEKTHFCWVYCCKGSGENNPEANVVWHHGYVGCSTESLNTWTIIMTCHACHISHALSAPLEPGRYTPIVGWIIHPYCGVDNSQTWL